MVAARLWRKVYRAAQAAHGCVPVRVAAAAPLAVALALQACAAGSPVVPQQPVPVAVADGVYVQAGLQQDWGPANLGQVANVGFIVGSRCVAVIDSGGSLAAGRALQAAITRTTDRPVCYVINTHAHPDHVLGNAAFVPVPGAAQAPQFVGHARLAAALAARGSFYLNALRRDFGPAHAGNTIVPPTLAVEHELELDLGGRHLQLRAWPTAHTNADLTVYDPAGGTLWLGDLVFAGRLPVLDGRLNGWLQAMAVLRGLPAGLAVPGHGPPSREWPALMQPQWDYLLRLQQDTREALRQGLSLAQAVQQLGADPPGHWLLASLFHKRNVTAAYAELEWQEQ